jgi:hypothetical protein
MLVRLGGGVAEPNDRLNNVFNDRPPLSTVERLCRYVDEKIRGGN